MKKHFLLLFILVLFNISLSYSYNPGEKPLSLKECINIALEKNIQIIQAQNNVEISQNNVLGAIGAFLPNLSANAGWSRTNSQRETMTINGIEVPMPINQTSNSFNTRISSGVNLFDGFNNISNLSAAKSNALSSEYNLKRTQQGIIMQVYSYYFNVLRMKELFKNAQDQLKASNQTLQKIKESEKLGAVSIANVYQQQAQVASDELNLVQAENNQNKAKADLAAFLTLNVVEDIQFEDSSVKTDIDPIDYTNLKNTLENFKSLVDRAFAARPDYKSSIEGVNASSSLVTSARGGIYPSVSASISYGLSSSEMSKLRDNRSLGWGINISLPIFNNFQTDNRIEQAKLNLKLNEEELRNTERTIQVDIKKALLDLDAAYKSSESAKKSSSFQKETMRIIQEKYNLGSSTLLDLLIATNNFNTAETARINATYSYLTAIKQIEYALGTLTN